MESLLLTLLTAGVAFVCLYGAQFCSASASVPDKDASTALKGVFALVVIFHHLAQRTWAGWIFQNFRGVGYLCVAGFFFLSGCGLLRQAHARPDYRIGFLRRRMLPILLPTAIVFVLCWALSAINGRLWTPWDMLLALPYGDTVIPFAWYVLSLLVFYPVFALCLKLCYGKPRLLPACTAGFTVLCILVCRLLGFSAFWYNTIPLLPLGMLYAVQEERLLPLLRKRFWVAAPPIWLAFLILYPVTDRIMGAQYGSSLCVLLNWVTSALFAASLVLLLLKVRFGNPLLQWLGRHSLELYLCQGIFMELTLRSASLYIVQDILYCLLSLAGTLLAAFVLRKSTSFLLLKIQNMQRRN